MNYCTSPQGTRIAYEIEGGKESLPLVLLHGFCEDRSVWSTLIPRLKTKHLIFMDLPGFGDSALPIHSDLSEHAEALWAVLEAEDIERCVLVGHSMGGYVALEFAARWPERLAGLGLFHAHPFADHEERKTARLRGIETLQAGKRDLYVAQLFPNLFAPTFLSSHPEVLNDLIANGKNQRSEGIISALKAMMNRPDHQQTLTRIACPVLFLLGTQDTLVPLDQALKAALLPQIAMLEILPMAAHMAMYECPEPAAEILDAFQAFCQIPGNL